MQAQKGFTLIEVMIVVGIIAILSAIAIPSYTDYMRRARITEATSTLGGMQVKFERYFQDNRSYAGSCTVAPVMSVAMRPAPTSQFSFLCTNLTATEYTITATGLSGTSLDGFAYQLRMVQGTGVVMSSTFPSASGWANNATCWAIKKDGAC